MVYCPTIGAHIHRNGDAGSYVIECFDERCLVEDDSSVCWGPRRRRSRKRGDLTLRHERASARARKAWRGQSVNRHTAEEPLRNRTDYAEGRLAKLNKDIDEPHLQHQASRGAQKQGARPLSPAES